MYRSDDPYTDFCRREFEMERIGRRLPSCNVCGEKIYSDTAMRNEDGEIVCHDCFSNIWSKCDIDDFM